MKATIFPTAAGKLKDIRHMDALWCKLDNRRVRFAGLTADGMVKVADECGKVLPDLRHKDQLLATG